LTIESLPERRFDLVVVGGGPAGLAATVYGASEGLRTLGVDMVAFAASLESTDAFQGVSQLRSSGDVQLRKHSIQVPADRAGG
jgi:thioredoxin reductase